MFVRNHHSMFRRRSDIVGTGVVIQSSDYCRATCTLVCDWLAQTWDMCMRRQSMMKYDRSETDLCGERKSPLTS